jgi:hypothetical protein
MHLTLQPLHPPEMARHGESFPEGLDPQSAA